MKTSDILLDGFRAKDPESSNYKIVFLKYFKYWYLYLLGLILSLSLAYVYLQYATKEYPVATTILLPSKNADFTQNAVFNDLDNYQSTKVVENEAEVIGSFSLMKMALQQLNFNVSYYIKDNALRNKEIYGNQLPIEVVIHDYDSMAFFIEELNTDFLVHIKSEDEYQLEDDSENLSSHRFDDEIETSFGKFSVEKGSSFTYPTTVKIKFENPFALPGRYSSKLDVFIVNKQASVIRVSLTDPVPEKGMLVLNKLIEVYNEEADLDKNKTARNTIDFIDEQLDELTTEIRKIEEEIQGYKTQNRITQLSTDAQKYIAQSSQSESALAEFTVQLQVLESIERYLSAEQYQSVPSTLTIEDPTLSNLISEFNLLNLERERMLRTTEPNNPLVLNINEQLVSIRRNILENIRNIKSSIEISRSSLQARSSQFESQSEKIPMIERQLLEISRQQTIKQEHYTYLVQKREEAALSLAATTVSNSRTIDPAMAGNSPVKPNKIIVMGLALVAGLGFPFGFVFLKYQLNQKILVKKDVTSKTSIPVLGEISHYNGKKPFRITNQDRTPVAEQFRLIRSNLQFSLGSFENKVILVTSSLSGEGKTFFSLNLGISLSMVDKKVAICEFDLRKPALLKSLNIKKGLGISDYLSDDAMGLAEIEIRDNSLPSNVALFGSGTIPENPSELMATPKVKHLIEQLKKEFDVVIIDSAPVGQVADAFSLSGFADITTYLLRYNYTPIEMLDFLNDIHSESKLENPVIVLNDAKLQMSYGYGYYESSKNTKKKSYTSSK